MRVLVSLLSDQKRCPIVQLKDCVGGNLDVILARTEWSPCAEYAAATMTAYPPGTAVRSKVRSTYGKAICSLYFFSEGSGGSDFFTLRRKE